MKDYDWIWKTILVIGVLGIIYGIGSRHGPISFKELVVGGKEVIQEWRRK